MGKRAEQLIDDEKEHPSELKRDLWDYCATAFDRYNGKRLRSLYKSLLTKSAQPETKKPKAANGYETLYMHMMICPLIISLVNTRTAMKTTRQASDNDHWMNTARNKNNYF